MASFLIADSGSTKTSWAWVDTQRPTEVKVWLTAGINPYFQNSQEIAQTLHYEQISKKYPQPVEQIFFYGAGCSTTENKQTVIKALKQHFPESNIQVETDMLGAARSLCLNTKGITCILGTGSNTCLYDGQAIAFQPLNLGFWLGDEGSGGYIGKQLILAFLHQTLPTHIAQDFSEKYELTLTTVLENAYQKPYPNRYFAQFAQFLANYQRDNFVHTLLYHSFEQFIDKYVSKIPNFQHYNIHFTGSIAYHFQAILRKVLAEKHLVCGKITESPVRGLIEYHVY
ncbi:MAG: N-acetylglucosamine kinase [Microscillaceae bacterium]|nr:N-acetylglucosamine kinase [Microscillaceae bacterium]MDW8461141.1 N-acetylglucosamine kinase [Cytophagales bacterium]